MDAKCSNCCKENRDKCDDYKPKMDAKEAIEYFKEVEFIDKWGPDEAGNGDSLIKQANDARLTAISALEKVETLEAENARLGHLLALANQELEKRM